MAAAKRSPMVKYSDKLADEICERISTGESLREICREKGKPSLSTVFRWLAENTTFREQYAHARAEQAEAYADEICSIADTEEDPQRARVRIDARKWVASKLKPQKYGDKQTVEHEGGIALEVISGVPERDDGSKG